MGSREGPGPRRNLMGRRGTTRPGHLAGKSRIWLDPQGAEVLSLAFCPIHRALFPLLYGPTFLFQPYRSVFISVSLSLSVIISLCGWPCLIISILDALFLFYHLVLLAFLLLTLLSLFVFLVQSASCTKL